MKCKHKKADGTRCKAHALNHSQYCFFHSKKTANKRLIASKRGGQKGLRKVLPLETEPLKLRNARDVFQFLNLTIQQVRIGVIDTKVGNCIAFVSQVALKAFEMSTIEERILKLEKTIEEREA